MINLECWGRSLGGGLEWEVLPYFVHDGIVLGTHADDGILVVVLLTWMERRGEKPDGSKEKRAFMLCPNLMYVAEQKKKGHVWAKE